MMVDKGRAAEYAFAEACMNQGLAIAFPCSELLSYDYVVDNGKCLVKVQVKSTSKTERGTYKIMTSRKPRAGGRTRRPYSAREIDFMVAWLAESRTFYIIPIEAVCSCKTITIKPGSRDCKWDAFKEAWRYLLPKATKKKQT